MNCQEFWNSLPRPGREISQEQTAHLAECSACAAEWEPHRALSAGLHTFSEEWRQQQAPDRVEVGLTAAFRMHAGPRTRRQAKPSVWRPVMAWASAAAAMIALAVVTIHGWQPSPSVRPNAVTAPQHPVQSAPLLAVADSDADDDSAVLGDGFVRLPNAPRLDPNEEYDVVQLAVPGSQVIAWGLPVSEDRARGRVVADVALGADGTMRAVRLLPATEGILE